MRFLFVALFVVCGSSSLLAAPQSQGFARDAETLRLLDAQQLRIVRRAGVQCWHAGQGGFGSRSALAQVCVINGTEGAIARAEDPQLKAFHDALPMHARYDEYRPAYFWQRLVQHGT